jgi:four helix bundle protein
MQLDNRFAFQKLDVYVAARELVSLVVAAKVRDGELRDQATRAAKSTFLAIAEGLPSESVKMRRVYFERARASLCETVAALDVGVVLGVVDGPAYTRVLDLARRVEAMLRAMVR